MLVAIEDTITRSADGAGQLHLALQSAANVEIGGSGTVIGVIGINME